ncbi:MAG: triphosphoribosyl-dephospho-CoA synthase [Bacteroidales bacterium]|nr:triphosphoribosyl-dephospho-CoA synthase [Bacteroidales bacterium]
MEKYENRHISEMPLSSPFFRKKVERFLGENGLRMEALDVYCAIEDEDGNILAGAGLSRDIIKCIAVASQARQEGLVAPLISHLISLASARGILELKLFTKPENQAIFESLGFHLLASAPKAILMENGRGLERYCAYLKGFAKEGRCGVVVMNANPFTLGHLYLLQEAARQVDTLYVIPVAEEGQLFSYAERYAMIQCAVENYFSQGFAKNQFSPAEIVVLEGSAYQISAATFPTYFLKDLSDAAQTQMLLDLDLYTRWIAPALNASVRFVGSEPLDALTNQYNTLIPNAVIIPRLTAEKNYFLQGLAKNQFSDADIISASQVRKYLAEGDFHSAAALCPETTWPYLLAALAQRALTMELNLPLKPGLVCPDSNGAHSDMDYALMQKGIAAIRPFFAPMGLAASADELRTLGVEAEKAMLAATGGVNTHRGAIFCLGLALNAWAQGAHNEELIQNRLAETAQSIFRIQLSDSGLASTPVTLCGARQIAASGYRILFEDWLPYLRTDERASSPLHLQKLLLRIMSTLDDTCVIKRAGAARAQLVKGEAEAMLTAEEKWFFAKPCEKYFSSAETMQKRLQELCDRYAAEGISPGGAADMLALTIFIDSII